jgi:hypothetical protein
MDKFHLYVLIGWIELYISDNTHELVSTVDFAHYLRESAQQMHVYTSLYFP